MPNYTPTTATVIPSLDYSDTVLEAALTAAPTGTGFGSTCDSTQYHALWWTYTTGPTETVIAVGIETTNEQPSNNYDPNISVWHGSLPSPTQYIVGPQNFCSTGLDGFFFEIPVTPNTQYWFQVTDSNNTNPLGEDLIFRAQAAPTSTYVTGDLCINDDEDDFPAIVLSQTDGSIRRFVSLPAGETADTFTDGTLCIQNGTADTGIAIFDATLTQVATYDVSPRTVMGVKSNTTDRFYIVSASGGSQRLDQIDGTGTLTDQWASMPSNFNAAACFAVTRDDAVFYYASRTDNAVIHAYDLVNDVALPDLHASVGEKCWGFGDGFVDASGRIYFGYCQNGTSGTTGKIRQFNSAGTILQTFTFTAGDFVRFNHFTPAPDGTTLWVWGYPAGDSPYTFRQIQLSDGTITTTITAPGMPDSGEPEDGEPFGVSDSCPLILLSAPITPTTVTYPIRRLRRFPIAYSQHKQLFLSRIEFILQPGVGLTSGQGSDPILMFRLSKDGGITWGQEMQMSIGKIGEYGKRAYLNRLGRGRNLVGEISSSDPVEFNLIDCVADIEEGSS